MIALPELHNLIKSLNKPEKRFFKLLSATENLPVDKAIMLFDFLEKINDTDDVYYKTDKENKIDTTFETLNLLYNLILQSQRSFYSETITGFSIIDELANLKILFDKAQYKQCRKMIKPTKQKSILHENFNFSLEILELEKQLLRIEFLGEEYFVHYNKIKEQQEEFIVLEKNVGTYYQLYSRLKFQIKSNRLGDKKSNQAFFENFLNDPYISDTSKALSKKSLFLLYKCRALCYNALKQQDLRRQHLMELKNFVQKNPFLFDEMPRQYMDVLYGLANVYIETGDFNMAQKTLSEIQNLVHTKKHIGIDLIIKLRSYSFTVELLILTNTGKFNEAEQLSQTIYEFVLENENIFNKEDKSVLLYNLTNLYIYSHNFKQAGNALKRLLNDSDKNARWDIKCYSRIQELIVIFELEEYSKLPLINNIIKNLAKDKVFKSESELRFIAAFSDIINEPSATVPRFKTLYNELKKASQNEDDKWVNFFYFNFLAYAGYKAGEGQMKEIITENFLSHETI